MDNLFSTNHELIPKTEKEKLLKQKGICLWLTGLSGSGKTSIAKAVAEKLHSKGFITKVLDGDNIRLGINKNLSFRELFQENLNSWPLYSTKSTYPSTNKKVFYLGDAFHAFLPTMAQGASQSIESAYELYNLLKSENKNAHNIYFKNRSERVKSIKKRSDLNFLAFHISNSIIKKIRNTILKRLV